MTSAFSVLRSSGLSRKSAALIVRIYMLRSSGISWKSAALIVRYRQKKKWISIVFYCSENLLIAHNLWTTRLIEVGFSAKCTSPSEHFNQIENRKCHMCEFRLIPLDRITYSEVINVFYNIKMTNVIWSSRMSQTNMLLVSHVFISFKFM